MNLFEGMNSVLKNEKTLTTNGATAYATSGHELLDFNYQLSAMRSMDENSIGRMFQRAYFENKELAIKYIFYVGDVREGAGERKVFRVCLKNLIDLNKDAALKVMHLVPEYNRWDSVVEVYLNNKSTRDEAVKLIKNQLNLDRVNMTQGKSISLCAKWMPSINTSSKQTVANAKVLARALKLTDKEYRKLLSAFRNYLKVTERQMSLNQWGDINYSAVPSKANLNYNNAFLKHDEDRRRKFLADLDAGEVKVNAGTLQPHEIMRRYGAANYYIREYDSNLEGAWKNLPNITTGNTLVVRDGSGSMTWSGGMPMLAADALSIYTAQHNTGLWKNKFITFSSRPQLVDISKADSLNEAMHILHTYRDCSNTDIEKTMKLILQAAVENHLSQNEMPEMILIVSDMQFDQAVDHFVDKSLFDEIAEDFLYAGYTLPRICFWNVNGSMSKTIPMQRNENGVILASGFSVEIMKMFMSNKTDPYEVLVDTLNNPRYDAVAEAIAS